MIVALEMQLPRLRASIPRMYDVCLDNGLVVAHACPLSILKKCPWGLQVEEQYGWDSFDFPDASEYGDEESVYAVCVGSVLSRDPQALLELEVDMVCYFRLNAACARKYSASVSTEVIEVVVVDMTLRRDSKCAWLTVDAQDPA